jgi:hypothetical protein
LLRLREELNSKHVGRGRSGVVGQADQKDYAVYEVNVLGKTDNCENPEWRNQAGEDESVLSSVSVNLVC